MLHQGRNIRAKSMCSRHACLLGFALLCSATAVLKREGWQIHAQPGETRSSLGWTIHFSSISADPFRCATAGARFTRRARARSVHTYIHTRQFTQSASSVAWRFINLRYCKPINKRGWLLGRHPAVSPFADHFHVAVGRRVRGCIPVEVRVYFRLFAWAEGWPGGNRDGEETGGNGRR